MYKMFDYKYHGDITKLLLLQTPIPKFKISVTLKRGKIAELYLARNQSGNTMLLLGVTSKLNRRLTAQNRRFRALAIVQNNSDRPEPPVTGGQPPVEF